MKTRILILVTLLFSVLNTMAEMAICRPRIGVPAFVETNGVFLVEVDAQRSLQASQWRVKLFNDLREWTDCRVEKAEYGQFVYNNSRNGWRLKVRVSTNIPPELFGITVSHQQGGTAKSGHSLKAVQAMESSFYILHFADPQIKEQKATAANGQGGNYGSADAMQWAAQPFNLINPRFMISTGDEMEDGDVNTAEKFKWYLAAMDKFDFPVLVTRGNNDRGDINLWKSGIGQPTYSISMGSFFVYMCDASKSGNEMRTWFTSDYSASFTNRSVKYRLLGQHFNSSADAKTPCAFTPPEGKWPDLMLVGHNHAFKTLQSAPYIVLSSGPAFNYGRAGFFDFARTDSGWTCSSVSAHGAGNVVQPFGDNGKPALTCVYSNQNNGTAVANSAEIGNSLGLDFPDGRVRFLMRRSVRGYKTTGGVKLSEYDYAGGSNTAVLVKVNILKNVRTTVSVLSN